MSYYVVQDRDDLFTPTPLVKAYLDKVFAPKKRLFVIEGAGHSALRRTKRKSSMR